MKRWVGTLLFVTYRKIYNINYEIIPHSLTTPIKDVKEKDKFLKDFKWRISEKPFKK